MPRNELTTKHPSRRIFLQSGVACAELGLNSRAFSAPFLDENGNPPLGKSVHFLTDGPMLTPLDYAELLVRLSKEKQVVADTYLQGGSVAEMEGAFAKVLGKESAVFVPTGTLANHLAIRVQGAGKGRVLVQGESHIYRDSFDCVQTRSEEHTSELQSLRHLVCRLL